MCAEICGRCGDEFDPDLSGSFEVGYQGDRVDGDRHGKMLVLCHECADEFVEWLICY